MEYRTTWLEDLSEDELRSLDPWRILTAEKARGFLIMAARDALGAYKKFGMAQMRNKELLHEVYSMLYDSLPGILSACVTASRCGNALNADLYSMLLIAAPSNLGLSPLWPSHEPCTWRAPSALIAAGLLQSISVRDFKELPRPNYSADTLPGTRLRNGHTIRSFNLPWRVWWVRRAGEANLHSLLEEIAQSF